MKRIPFHCDWSFVMGDHDWMDQVATIKVDLPHDYIIGMPRKADALGTGSNGYFGEGKGEYTKRFTRTQEMIGTVLLVIDGAYMNAEVVLNGRHLATHPYGYTAFQVDLSSALRDGENVLTITTQSRQPSTRWYSGGGLYRDVYLLAAKGAHINPWNVFITTTIDDGCARVHVDVGSDSVKIRTRILFGEELVGEGEREVVFDEPQLWSINSPVLYTARIELLDGERVLDCHEQVFGIRKIEIDAVNGFRLNGEAMKLRGGCIHHDNGLLGAAALPDAESRKVATLKAMGYNAIRSSHYPPSSALLDACDRLGMLVMDEAFDVWVIGKKSLDYHLYFRDWWERDIESMVRRDRNHPCIFAWSIGNEIAERDSELGSQQWAHILGDKVRSLDSTRPITAALNNIFTGPTDGLFSFDSTINPIEAQNFEDDQFALRTKSYCDALDMVGYNYLLPRYEYDRTLYPDRVIVGTETFASNTYDYWKATEANPNVIGDFIWTAWDYLGEAGIGRTIWEDEAEHSFSGRFPWMLSYDADFDLIGNRRPQGWFREILWGQKAGPVLMTLHPNRHGVRSKGMGWDWPDVAQRWNYDASWLGKPVNVFAYADADEVEFVLNGVSVAIAKVDKLCATTEVAYEPGELTAIARRDGHEVGRSSLESCGAPASLRLTPDKRQMCANGLDLCHIGVDVLDEAGRVVTDADVTLTVCVSGVGTLAGVGSANPFSEQPYPSGIQDTYQGRALIIVRAGNEVGELSVTVSVQGLQVQNVQLMVKANGLNKN